MNKLKECIDFKLLKYISIITIFIMIAAHGFCYFNLLYSHDSLNIIHKGYYSDSLEIGRFLIPAWNFFRGYYYPPVVIGILSIIFMIAIVYFISKMFNFKEKKHIFLITIILCTCTTLTLLNATYINYSDMYLFTFLLNVLAAYFIRKKSRLSLIAIIMLVVSFAIYPSYLGVVLGIYIGLLLIDLFNNKNWKDVLKEGIRFVIYVIISLIIYAICNKLLLKIFSIDLNNNYNSINNVLSFSSLTEMFECIKNTYINYFNFLFYPHTFHRTVVLILNVIIVLISIFNAVVLIKKNKLKKANIILILLLCLIIPFSLNIIYFISGGVIHELMIFAINITYIYFVWLLSNNNDKKILTKIVYGAFFIIACLNVIYSNQMYEKKKIELDSTISTMNRVILQIENVEGYEMGKTPVVIIGDLSSGPLAIRKEYLDYDVAGQNSTFVTTYNRNYYRFIKYYMGYPINIVDNDKGASPLAMELSNKEEIKNMPCYPDKESIKMIDGYLIIKFS